MYRLKWHGITMPPIYVVEPNEREEARRFGIPFLIKPSDWTDEDLIKVCLYHWLVSKFPNISWSKVFDDYGMHSSLKVNVPAEYRENPGCWTDGWTSDDFEVTEGGAYRETAGGMEGDDVEIDYDSMRAWDFFDPSNVSANVEVLQKLKLLPKFMSDITDAIKSNLLDTSWMDGWNKKLDAPLGCYQGSSEAPNLIILDVSGSIPRGIASTMIGLIDTLRTQANADLIITSGTSKYWKRGDKLPTPTQLSYLVGGCNEATQFYQILNDHVLGKHWGNVIVFGDQDCPTERRFSFQQENAPKPAQLSATRIDNLMSFHTYCKLTPGYGRWVKDTSNRVPETIDTSWVSFMEY